MKNKFIKFIAICVFVLAILFTYFHFQQNKNSAASVSENNITVAFETQPPTEVANIAKNNLTPYAIKTNATNSGPKVKLDSFYKIYNLSYKNISDFTDNTDLFSVLEPRGWYYTTTADLSSLDNVGNTFQSWKDKGTNFDFYDKAYEVEFTENSWQLVTNHSSAITIDLIKDIEKNLPKEKGYDKALLYIGHPPCAFVFSVVKKDDIYSLYPVDPVNWGISKELHNPFEVMKYIKSIDSCKQYVN